MPEIKFERYERDCDYNRSPTTHPRQKLNDFKVIIDGDERALLKRNVCSRGYYLTDLDGRAIKRPSRRPFSGTACIEIASQAEFERGIKLLLDEGLIPDMQTLEEVRAQEAAAKIEKEREELERKRRHRMNEAAPQMYAILKYALETGAILNGRDIIDVIDTEPTDE